MFWSDGAPKLCSGCWMRSLASPSPSYVDSLLNLSSCYRTSSSVTDTRESSWWILSYASVSHSWVFSISELPYNSSFCLRGGDVLGKCMYEGLFLDELASSILRLCCHSNTLESGMLYWWFLCTLMLTRCCCCSSIDSVTSVGYVSYGLGVSCCLCIFIRYSNSYVFWNKIISSLL